MTERPITIAVVNEEIAPAREWAARAGVELEWLVDSFEIRATLVQRRTEEKFFLLGRIDGYRLVPPCWDFRDADWKGESDRRNYPSHGAPPGIGSVFHSNGVICAPFNRLAFRGYTGLHRDWGDAQNWVHVAGGHVRADTLADMLATIQMHLHYTNGRLG